ncbi:MAG: hypothetical protein GY810_24355, partial [Aureispira sp.]|nr:hypothetical protein [Aureispira sp.]
FTSEKAYEEIYSKHFKKYYNGKPTKRYKRLLQKIEDAEKVDMRALERMF